MAAQPHKALQHCRNPGNAGRGRSHIVKFTTSIDGETGPQDLQTHPRAIPRCLEPTGQHYPIPGQKSRTSATGDPHVDRLNRMITVQIEAANTPDVYALIEASDVFHAALYPQESIFTIGSEALAAANSTVWVARDENGQALGMVALVREPDGRAELKRMFVHEWARGRGAAKALVAAAEDSARTHGVRELRLETGRKQPEAIGLYTSLGYRPIPLFGQYIGDPTSLCFAKVLVDPPGA